MSFVVTRVLAPGEKRLFSLPPFLAGWYNNLQWFWNNFKGGRVVFLSDLCVAFQKDNGGVFT